MSDTLQAEIELLKRSLERERKGRKDAEEVLRAKTFELLEAKKVAQTTANRLQQALAASKQIVWEWDADTDEIWMYASVKEAHSKVERRLKKSELIASLRPSHRQVFEQQFDAHANGKSKRFSVLVERVSNSSNEARWIRLSGQCILRDENGNMKRLLGTYKDITNQHREREIYELVTRVFVHGKKPSFIASLEDKQVQINTSFANLFGIQGRSISWDDFCRLVPIDLIQSNQVNGTLSFCADLWIDNISTSCDIKLTEMHTHEGKYQYINGTCCPISK